MCLPDRNDRHIFWVLRLLHVLGVSSILCGRVLGSTILTLPSQNPQAAPALGAIQGLVARQGTFEPVSKAAVELRGDDDPMPPLASTTTETDGRFSFRNLAPGRYRLVATRPGYVGRPVAITVASGRTAEAAVAMTTTGAIAGRVYGQNSEPLGNIDVAALKPSYQNGRRVLTAVQSARTNDRGEYRLFWLAPGRYVVRATHPQAEAGPMAMFGQGRMGRSFELLSGGGLGPNGFSWIRATGDPVLADAFGQGADALTERYVPIYFPGTADGQAAAAIDVRPGADVGAIDVQVTPVRERHVRGVVINGATGQVAQFAGLSEIQPGPLAGDPSGGLAGGLSNGGLAPIDPDGAFDVTLLPGRHTLRGTAGTGVGFASLEIRDADLDGVRIIAMPEFNITGRIVTDPPLEHADLTSVHISLGHELPVATPSTSYSLPRADGSFVVAATPGDYRVNVAPFLNLAPAISRVSAAVPKGFERAYVKSIRLGDVDVLNGGVHLDGPTTSSLEIVLGMSPGSVEGTVLSDASSAPGGLAVTLLPNIRGRFDLVRTATTDPAGRFHLDRVVPGDYKAFVWTEASDADWQDPDFVRVYEARGTPVHVVSGRTENVRLMAIAP
jgi:hypothetical protein